ncbi:major facilitator superfamily domain-containing protein [Gigaspora rosea]|uniref:Major facilitator superfamily domain-containing protein n=1 Tax=Gigaspora rosea TaxID=44941 RepID=A0A397UL16_9GLOM|nr:major facilitator superfamily domain-containing protein [Gigaspora rosea]
MTVNSLVSVILFFAGIAPIAWAAYSDRFATRREVYLLSILVFIIPTILCSLAKKFWQLMILCAIQSCGSSALISISAGIISDIYFSTERGSAFGIFYLAFWLVNFIASMSGGYIIQYLNWQWMFYTLAIYGSFIFLLVIFFIPETFCRINLPTTTTPSQNIFNLLAPLNVPRNFSARPYNLLPSSIGLLFLAPAIGYALGSLIGGKYSDFVLQRVNKEGSEIICSEMRIKGATVGALIIPCSYLVYGWLLADNFNIYILMILWFFGAFGTSIVFNSLSTYLIDVCPGFDVLMLQQ